MTNKIIAVDYDGTLDFSGYPRVGLMNLDLIAILKRLQEDGNQIVLWTCRDGESLRASINECRKYGLEFDTVNENIPRLKEMGCFNSPKIVADFYIDDRAITPQIWELVHKQIDVV